MRFFRRNRRFWTITFTVLLLVLVVLTEYSWARAGGGGGFRSGGSGGGSFGGGGSGGGGDLIGLLLFLIIRCPYIGIPVAIFVIIFFIFAAKKGHSARMTHVIRRAYSRQDANSLAQAEAALKQRDPNFTKEGLAQRIMQGFEKIQKAWADQDMKPVRQLVSDGVYERFSTQLRMQQSCHIRNTMKNVTVHSVEVAGIQSDSFFDTVQLKITASAIDQYVNLEKNKVVYGSSSPEMFTEYWSLLRRPGARTLNKPGLFEGFCPNCGSPLEIADVAECPSCKALVNSGDYDWVLAEITQASEFQDKPPRDIPGVETVCAKDPAFNVQHLEDRSSVMFYRWTAARYFADKSYITKLAADEFIKTNQDAFRALPNGKHQFFADASIGSVELVEIKTSDDPEEMDSARIKITWSGHQEEENVPGYVPINFDASRLYMQEFILKRKSSARSSGKNVLASCHCPGCGAPETRSDKGYCEYCHTPVNDGSHDWNLFEIRAFTGYPPMPRPVAETVPRTGFGTMAGGVQTGDDSTLSVTDNEHILACATALMLADGHIDDTEKELLQNLAQSKGIGNAKLQQIVNSVSAGELEVPQPESLQACKEFLRCMVLMCLMDGKVTSSERDLLKKLVAKMGYTDVDINMMIKKERVKLYQNARKVK